MNGHSDDQKLANLKADITNLNAIPKREPIADPPTDAVCSICQEVISRFDWEHFRTTVGDPPMTGETHAVVHLNCYQKERTRLGREPQIWVKPNKYVRRDRHNLA